MYYKDSDQYRRLNCVVKDRILKHNILFISLYLSYRSIGISIKMLYLLNLHMWIANPILGILLNTLYKL